MSFHKLNVYIYTHLLRPFAWALKHLREQQCSYSENQMKMYISNTKLHHLSVVFFAQNFDFKSLFVETEGYK